MGWEVGFAGGKKPEGLVPSTCLLRHQPLCPREWSSGRPCLRALALPPSLPPSLSLGLYITNDALQNRPQSGKAMRRGGD